MTCGQCGDDCPADFVTVGEWRGCAWVADLRALLTEGGEG